VPEFAGLDALLWPVLDGEVLGATGDEGDDAEEESFPAPAADVLDPPELREAHPASAANTTAVVATVFTRGFIVLHLLAEHCHWHLDAATRTAVPRF
jgi:hypothetical protein